MDPPQFLDHPLIIVGALVFMFLASTIIWATRYRRVGPNEVLVVSGGQRGVRFVRGGGTFVFPIFEQAHALSLEMMNVPVAFRDVGAQDGSLAVEGVAQIKIGGDEASIRAAAERFLTKTREEIADVFRQALERRLRAIVEEATLEAIGQGREAFARRVQDAAAADLAGMGMKIESFVLQKVMPS